MCGLCRRHCAAVAAALSIWRGGHTDGGGLSYTYTRVRFFIFIIDFFWASYIALSRSVRFLLVLVVLVG